MVSAGQDHGDAAAIYRAACEIAGIEPWEIPAGSVVEEVCAAHDAVNADDARMAREGCLCIRCVDVIRDDVIRDDEVCEGVEGVHLF